MNWRNAVVSCALAGVFIPVSSPAFADDEKGNWRKGRVYYRMVCTNCHREMAKPISPVSKTMAEWKAYVAADKHDASGKTNPSLKYYVSKEYRESIKAENKAAAKMIKMSDEQLLADVRAFVVHGAKDSDTPATCQ